MAEKYRPSNGTEGDCFIAKWCAKCTKDTEGSPCRILGLTFMLDEDDDDYPSDWIVADGVPTCTAFVSKNQEGNRHG